MYNDYQKLSKKDKKIVRALIDKGIAEDFKRGMQHFDQLIQQLKSSPETPQEQYYKLYHEVRDFDKQISRMYDRLTVQIFLPSWQIRYCKHSLMKLNLTNYHRKPKIRSLQT